MNKSLVYLLWFSRLFVGLLFIFSGLIKANDTIGFGYKLDEYFDVFGMPFLKSLSWSLSAFICVLEIFLGVALITGYRFALSAWLLLLLIVFFTFLTGYSAIFDKVTDCGCFGDAIPLTPWQSFYKDLILLVFILVLFFLRKQVKPLASAASVTWALSFLTAVFTWYTWQHLPVIDFRSYKPGTNLKVCTTKYVESLGKIKCKDYFPFKVACETDEFEGNTLMVIMYDMEKASDEGIQKSVSLANSLNGTGVKVMGGTGSGSDTRDAYVKRFGIPYCLSPQDVTMLKTMVRSNPGFILLKEGRVLKMWHHNDTPDKQEILARLGK
jgi:uncharacterized membrane protein YphA (DoxX/SURF4 family)